MKGTKQLLYVGYILEGVGYVPERKKVEDRNKWCFCKAFLFMRAQ